MNSDDMHTTGSSTYHIDKLTETNYRSWAQQVRWILDERDLWDLVIGKEPKPSATIQQTNSTVEGTTTNVQNDQHIAAWHKKAKKARSIIGSSLSASVMTYVEGLDDPVDIWKSLADKYDPKTQTTLIQVVREFMTARMDERNETMEQHLQKVQRLKRQVEEHGEQVSNLIYNSILLNSVPESYKIAISILESQQDLTPQVIINRLLEESRKMADSEDFGKKATTALLSNKANNPKNIRKPKREVKCDHCARKGHTQAECWIKHPEKKPERNRPKDAAKKTEARFAMSAGATIRSSDTKQAPISPSYWYLDSGASEHFSPYRDLFETYKDFKQPCQIITAEGTSLQGIGIGTIRITTIADDKEMEIPITNVIYAPDMHSNLLSTTTLIDRNFHIEMGKTGVNIFKDGELVSNTIRVGKLYRLKTASYAKVTVSNKEQSIQLWHRRMGHLGEANLRKLEKLAEGVTINATSKLGICGSCQEGKQTRTPSNSPAKRAKEPLELIQLIHSDLCGPIHPTSVGGANYFGLFIDDATRMTCIVPLKTKESGELVERFKEYQAQVEKQLNMKIKRIRTDGGREYLKDFEKYLKDQGIIHETTAPYSPEQNGVSERANRTILERTKAILAESQLPKGLWMEIATTVVYLKNRSPTTALEGITPFEAWFGKKPNLSHLKSIGCTAYVHVPKEKRKKLDSHSRKCKLVGYAGTNQYRLWDPAKCDVVISRDVIFDENIPEIAISDDPPPRHQTVQVTIEDENKVVNAEETVLSDDEEDIAGSSEQQEVNQPGPKPITRKSQRSTKGQPAKLFADIEFGKRGSIVSQAKLSVAAIEPSDNLEDPEPQTMTEALQHPTRGKEWEKAIQDEYNSLIQNETWELCKLPEGRKTISCKWIFRHKVDADGKIVRLKGRLVARGFSQVYGVDYTETFAPVAKFAALRTLLAIAAVEDLEVHQMDVVTAFLAGDLTEDIYMDQPEGFNHNQGLVCKLKKSLYGLKQAPRIWNRKFHKFLKTIGFKRFNTDHCVYLNRSKGTIIAIWVDDLILVGKIDQLTALKSDLSKEFQMKDLGELKYFLGICVERDRRARTIRINQAAYIDKILERFDMKDCHPTATPLAAGTRLAKAKKDDEMVDEKMYQRKVGSIMYNMIGTRPDIAYAVSQVSEFSANPNTTHLTAVQHILRYLKGTKHLSITYGGSDTNLQLQGYTDADFGGSNDRRSTSGYVFVLGGGAISWCSKRQSTVALSTTEAEYMALTQATKEYIWLKTLWHELGRQSENQVIFVDNNSAIDLANNPEYHSRTKHIDVEYHFIREKVENKEVNIVYCPTDDMIADLLTKPLSKVRHQKLVKMAGMD